MNAGAATAGVTFDSTRNHVMRAAPESIPYPIAGNLVDKHDLTVITTAVNIALMLGTRPGIDVMLAGGEFKPPTLSLTGRKAADFFTSIHVDKAFMAVAGVSVEAGPTYPGFNDLPLKRAIAEAASEVFLVADSTKIGTRAFATLGGIDMVGIVITDSHIADTDRTKLEQAGVEVRIARPGLFRLRTATRRKANTSHKNVAYPPCTFVVYGSALVICPFEIEADGGIDRGLSSVSHICCNGVFLSRSGDTEQRFPAAARVREERRGGLHRV